jgi:hypothetical protein
MVNVTWVSMTDIFAEPLALTESQNYGYSDIRLARIVQMTYTVGVGTETVSSPRILEYVLSQDLTLYRFAPASQ